jgi:flagellar hook assembly protein FlgD
MGRVVKTLLNSSQTAGYKSTQWNATNNQGQPVSAGVYLYSIEAGEFRQTKKMILLK